MNKFTKVNRTAIKKLKIDEQKSDAEFWRSQPPELRLEALEQIREEYNRWKYGPEQGFQRVYTIIKRS